MAKYTPIKKNISSLSRSEKSQPKISGDTKLRKPREVLMEPKRNRISHDYNTDSESFGNIYHYSSFGQIKSLCDRQFCKRSNCANQLHLDLCGGVK